VAWRHNHKGYFMPFFTKPFMAAALATTLLTAPATFAQDGESADPSQVLATVNGVDITLAHVIAARADLPQQYAQFPAALLFDGLVDQLINQTLLMQSVEGEPSLRARTLIENEERAVIASDAIGALVSGGVDEDELRAAYEEQYPEVEGQQEYRASHILVETEEEAACPHRRARRRGRFRRTRAGKLHRALGLGRRRSWLVRRRRHGRSVLPGGRRT
jgi:peptidyl-prolyl cis-trans isomerase C